MKFAEIFGWVVTNWDVIFMIATGGVTFASVIAKATGNVTASKYVYIAQKVVDTIAMSSTPTEYSKVKFNIPKDD